MGRTVNGRDELWIPLVDEPIGELVQQLERHDPDVARLIQSPRRLLAFRTFAYIRVGIVLGEMLVESDVSPADGDETWIEPLLREPANRAAVVRAVRAVAEQIAADPEYAEDELVGPDDGARDRFRSFVRRELRATS